MIRAPAHPVASLRAWPLLLPVAWLAPACGEAGGAGLARPTLDTLPNGVLQVRSSGPTGWRADRGWRLVEALRITGEEGSEAELINPVSMTVDEAGRIWVVDQKPAAIKVYAPDGRFIRTVGREGAGPGEFRVGFIAPGPGVMVLHDPQASRTTVFDSGGAYLRSWASFCCYWSEIHVDRQGRVYIPGMTAGENMTRGTTYYRFTLDGEVVDTIYVPGRDDLKYWTVRAGTGQGRMMMSMSVPFAPRIYSTFDPDGGFVYGWSGAYEFTVTRTGPDSAVVFGRDWTPEPIGEDARRDTIEAMIASRKQMDESLLRAAFKFEEMPATRPAFEAITVAGDGHRWVRVGPDSTGGILFDVFDPQGAWLGALTSPIGFSAYGGVRIGAAEMVVLTEGADGRPAVVKLRIEKEPQ